MSKRQYTKFKSESYSDESIDIHIDLSTVESFEQEGDVLIVHKDSGLWNRIIISPEEFNKQLIKSQ